MESRSASNYKLALRTLQERLDRIMLENAGRDYTLGTLAERYLEEINETLRPSTVLRNMTIVERMVGWLGADVYISHLTVPYVRNILKKNASKPVTYNEYLKRFKTFLNWCYMNDYLKERQLMDKLQPLPDPKKERIVDKYLEADELRALLAAADDPLWSLVIRFLVLSGLRIGELIALQNSDINGDYISVTKTWETGARVLVDAPKTASSFREVYMRPELRQVVNEMISYMRVYKFERGIRSDLFVCNPKGGVIKYDLFRKYLHQVAAEALGRDITPHALRHTAASLLIADGVPLDVVSRMLGHDGSRITKQIYIHITQELKNHDREILEKTKII
jgi:integrase